MPSFVIAIDTLIEVFRANTAIEDTHYWEGHLGSASFYWNEYLPKRETNNY